MITPLTSGLNQASRYSLRDPHYFQTLHTPKGYKIETGSLFIFYTSVPGPFFIYLLILRPEPRPLFDLDTSPRSGPIWAK